jgi:hypothetical protein
VSLEGPALPFDLTPLPIREVIPGLLPGIGQPPHHPKLIFKIVWVLRNLGRAGHARTTVASAPREMSPCLTKGKQELPS